MSKILILGGTREAAELASQLVGEGHEVTTSLAGRTREPRPVAGEVRIGGFGGVDGLIAYLEANEINLLIDATHPFAVQISENAARASQRTGITLERLGRKPWLQRDGDNWIEVANLDEALHAIPDRARVLLALGSQHIARFASRSDVFFLVRMVDPPDSSLPLENHQLLIGKPEKDPEKEARILREHGISHIVCRNSGGPGAYAKIEAARNLCLPVIIVSQPGT